MALFTTQAVKERLHARLAIDGPTGSGKTYTGLQAARILAGPTGKIGVIDTENRSAAYYSPDPAQLATGEPIERTNYWDAPYEFFHEEWAPPYDPRVLADVIKAAGRDGALGTGDVMLIDSLTHFYAGEGGTLDIVDNAADRSYNGNKFSGWKEGSPAQRHLLDTIIHAPFHVVCTMRSKMEYVLVELPSGKKQPQKIGMAPEQRAGIEYEFTAIMDMDLEHRMVVGKSRCDLIADRVAPKGRSAEVFEMFAGWLGSGVQRITIEQRTALFALVVSIADPSVKDAVKEAFGAEWGPTPLLTTDRYEAALSWLSERVQRAGGVVPAAPRAEGALADAVARIEELADQDRPS